MNKSITMPAVGVALCVLLGGCGGSSGNASMDASASAATPSGGGTDAFLAEVTRILGTTSDSTEPSATDQINAMSPDNTEPAPVS